MKKFLFLLLFLLPLSTFSQEITLTSLQSKFRAAYIQEYNLQNLRSDILAQTGSEWIYQNSIQYLSKERSWDKSKFDHFVTALKNKKTEEAALLYDRDWQVISPFLPTCCTWKKYIAFKGLKNGILTLSMGGNGEIGYSFEYIFYTRNRLYSITGQSYFVEELNVDRTKNATLKYRSNPKNRKGVILKSIPSKNDRSFFFSWLMQYWFDNLSVANPRFKYEYNKFVGYMTTIWK